MNDTLEQRFTAVRREIEAAARNAGRDPLEVKLVAVSKTHPAEILEEAIEAGAKIFGENKVQEAESKIEKIGRRRAAWHLIGHLQSNKARLAVQLFDVIHTLDSLKLARRLERICEEETRENLAVLIQVDLAKEETKNGIAEEDVPPLVAFLQTCKHLKFEGLMIIPPFFEDAEKTRPYFKKLRQMRDEILPGGELSMGMSHDFQVAIEEGATLVRVGTAIFGRRG